MNRKEGYYWVRLKDDSATAGDLDILMGLMSPKPGDWFIAKWLERDLEWEIGTYALMDGYFSEINKTPILSPDELIKIDQSTKDDSPTSPLDLSQEIEDFVTDNPVLHSIFFKHYRAHE